MPSSALLQRAATRIELTLGTRIKRHLPGGAVTFTFDDVPKTACIAGAPILERYDARGTYYIASGLVGKPSPLGSMFDAEDLINIHESGHEIAGHTFSHLNCAEATRTSLLSEVRKTLQRWLLS